MIAPTTDNEWNAWFCAGHRSTDKESKSTFLVDLKQSEKFFYKAGFKFWDYDTKVQPFVSSTVLTSDLEYQMVALNSVYLNSIVVAAMGLICSSF